jgi:hypothetical protein
MHPPQDKNHDGSITHAEFLKGLKENPWVAGLLGNLSVKAFPL